jgi:hypothetical protein
MPSDAIVRAVQHAAPEDGAVVSYDVLPQAEQQIALTAIEEEFYHARPRLPDAIRSFADRFEDVDDAVLEYQNTTFALWIRIEDYIRATTAPSPENEPSSGFF